MPAHKGRHTLARHQLQNNFFRCMSSNNYDNDYDYNYDYNNDG